MHSIYTAGRNVAHSLQPCLLPCRRWPVLRFNTSLIRAQHHAAHPQAPGTTSRPRADIQRPLCIEETPQSVLQHANVNTDDSPAGPAQGVSGPSCPTPTTNTRDTSQPHLRFICEECGSTFRTQKSLHDHHLNNKSQERIWGEAGGCKHRISVVGMKVNPHILKYQDPRDLRFTVGLGGKILEISSRELQPSPVTVSQDSGYQVVSTFNINTKPGEASHVSVPGSPPFWKDSKLPIRLPQEALDKTQPQDHHSRAFSMSVLSAHTTATEFWHDQVDIITHVSLLRTLLRFSKGSRIHTFRFFLQMNQGSLFLSHDPTLPSSLSENEILRSAVRKCCTEMPPGLEHGTNYHGMQYSIGHLNCVVQRRVDALYNTSPGELQQPSSPSLVGSVVGKGYHSQSKAATIQVHRNGGRWNALPIDSFWFSRTPLLLRARLNREGVIKKVTKIDTVTAVSEWEKDEIHQVALRKLATLLSDLKRAVKVAAPNGQACFGLIERERDLEPPTIQVFLGQDKSGVVPKDINNLWVGKTSHGPDEASDGGGGDSASEANHLKTKQQATATIRWRNGPSWWERATAWIVTVLTTATRLVRGERRRGGDKTTRKHQTRTRKNRRDV